MKKHIIITLTILCFLVAPVSKAQFSFGTDGFVIKSGASVSLDGLTISADDDLVLSNKTLLVSHTAIAGWPNNSIQRVYSFNEEINFTGTLGIFYLASELNGNSEGGLQISSSGAAGNGYVTSTGSTVEPGSHYVFNTFNAAYIRIISAVETGSLLPVKLIDFTAKKENGTALLQWSTSFETNSSHFEIQRSWNGKNWHAIGQVAASIESKSTMHYTFTDVDPSGGDPSGGDPSGGDPSGAENLYRLKMVDLDETFAYSSIRSLHFENSTKTTLFPNPVADRLHVAVQDWKQVYQISIINTLGLRVYESNPLQLKTISASGIDVRNLSVGPYIVKVTDKNGFVKSFKMVKQ